MIMKKTLSGLAFSAALLVTAQANATITLSSPGAPTGPTTSTYESFTSPPTLPAGSDAFGTYSGTAPVAIENTTVPLLSVLPGGLTSGVNNYLAVMNGGSETVTLATTGNTLGLLWGSVDSYNTLTLATSSGPVVITGATLLALNPALVYGTTSEYVTLSGFGTITGFTMASSLNSFETDEYSIATVVPETSTWAMMLIGFASVGFLSYRNRNRRPALRLV